MEGDPYLRRRRRSAGSTLMVVLAVVFMLLAIVMALHHHESVARRSYTQAEADLRFREARRFALRERMLGTAPPSDLAFTVDTKDITPGKSLEIPKNYADKLFERKDSEWSGIPDLKEDDSEDGGKAHNHRFIQYKPKTTFSSLDVHGKRTYLVVENQVPGYALYAPAGNIDVERVEGWGNPAFEDKDAPALESYSGVPVVLGAKGDVKVGTLTYGEAHSTDGKVTIGAGEGVGYKGPLPMVRYEDPFLAQVQSAKVTLDASTTSGDKTALLNGNGLSLDGIIDLFFGGGSVESLLGLRQAWKFPMPMIPGFSATVPGVFFEFWFHVPFPPDAGFGNSTDPSVTQLQNNAKAIEDATKAMQDLKKKVDDAVQQREAAQKAFNDNPNAATQMALDNAKAAEQAAIDAYKLASKALEDMSKQSNDIVNSKAATGTMTTPETRNQDPKGTDGIFGWNYSKVIGNMLGLLLDTITGDFENIAKRLSADVRVVHFGPPDNVPFFDFGSTFTARSTMTVPRGRSLRFRGNMEIQGDLWIQRGAVMAVHGNLKLEAPGPVSPTDPFPPSGRLFLEEGASLVVHGNFECEGSPRFGSVMAGGEPGEIHPITASILCDGSVNIPYGIYSGAALDDAVGLALLDNVLVPLMEGVGPNVSKIVGPFHRRKPYFAKYATTFQLTIIPPTIFNPPIPIPTPVPLPKDNMMVLAFRALTLAYTGILNASLGENFYPRSDWWPFGDGVVPMTTKVSPEELKEAVKSVVNLGENALGGLENLDDKVKNATQKFIEQALIWAAKQVIQKLVSEIAVAALPGGSIVGTLMNEITKKLGEDEKSLDELFDDFVKDAVGSVTSPVKEMLTKLKSITNLLNPDDYVREHSGILVYAGQNLTFGNQAKLAAGLFVAGQDILCQAELTIGTLLSRNGSIKARRLLFYPYFNQASLYVPKSTPSDWLGRALETDYGSEFDSGKSVQVGPPPVTRKVTAEGWMR